MIVRRIYETVLALACLIIFMPVVWCTRLRKRPAVRVVSVYGKLGQPVSFRLESLFVGTGPLRLLNYWHFVGMIALGRFGWTGPRPVRVSRPRPAYSRYAVRPGLISPYMLQKRMNIAFNDVNTTEERFIRGASTSSHVALLLRFLLALVVGGSESRVGDRIELLDITLHNHSIGTALEAIRLNSRSRRCQQIAFVNPDCINIACRDAQYKALLKSVPMVLADGIGIHLALKLFTRDGLRDNVNGTDLFPKLCKMAARENLGIFLLGGAPGAAESVAEEASSRIAGLQIAGTHHGFFEDQENASVLKKINASGAHILLVAMGAPKQEKWIADNAGHLQTGVAMGVGGLFDFYSGRIARAPLWMREMGLEWVYRLLQEPARMWRRYVIGNPLFLWRVWRWTRARDIGAGSRIRHGLAGR